MVFQLLQIIGIGWLIYIWLVYRESISAIILNKIYNIGTLRHVLVYGITAGLLILIMKISYYIQGNVQIDNESTTMMMRDILVFFNLGFNWIIMGFISLSIIAFFSFLAKRFLGWKK